MRLLSSFWEFICHPKTLFNKPTSFNVLLYYFIVFHTFRSNLVTKPLFYTQAHQLESNWCQVYLLLYNSSCPGDTATSHALVVCFMVPRVVGNNGNEAVGTDILIIFQLWCNAIWDVLFFSRILISSNSAMKPATTTMVQEGHKC